MNVLCVNQDGRWREWLQAVELCWSGGSSVVWMPGDWRGLKAEEVQPCWLRKQLASVTARSDLTKQLHKGCRAVCMLTGTPWLLLAQFQGPL